jgi:hypothetical protein
VQCSSQCRIVICITLCCLFCGAVSIEAMKRPVDDWCNRNNFEGSGHGLTDTFTWHLPGGTEECHESVSIASVPA